MSHHELSTLPSGIRVVTESIDAVRSVSVGLWVGVGSRDESPAEHGCSHFLEHLLFKGTARRSAREIAEALDAVGGEMNAFTSKEMTCFYARVLDQDLPLAMDVLGDMLAQASNTERDVEAERQVVLSELDIHLDTPEELAHSDFMELLLDRHPLSLETLGTLDSITALTRDTIHDYYRHHYRPENLVVAAAGNVDHAEVVRLAEGLGDLGRPGGHRPDRRAPDRFVGGEVHVRPRPTEQAHMVLGGPGLHQDDEDRFALKVLDTLLGGGMSSRLFQELREVHGLCYSTYSYAASFTDAGFFAAYVGTAPGKADEALALLRRELDRVPEDVQADEVARAKGALRGGLVLSLEDTGSRMTRLGKQVVTGSRIITVDEALARIDAVDVERVRAVAERVLAQPRDLAVVGPFAPGEVDRFAEVVAGP